MFSSYGDKFEVVSVNDVAVDDISEHLRGVDAVIHAAAPLPSKGDQKALLNASIYYIFILGGVFTTICLQGALAGSMNVIRQAEKAGIKKIVYTSSIVTVMNPSGSLTDQGNIITQFFYMPF